MSTLYYPKPSPWYGVRLSRTVHDSPTWLDDSDICYYLREYTPDAGYSGGVDPETNQRIHNYKKPVDRRGLPEWKYKERAIRQFAAELATLLKKNFTVTWIPSSKRPESWGFSPGMT